jgi:hypothetical protein
LLAPAAAPAQEAPAATNTPATDAIGPQELQNFSLSGKVTRPADQPPASPASTRPTPTPAPAASARTSTRPPARAVPQAAPPSREPAPAAIQTAERAPDILEQTPPSSSVTVALPKLGADSSTPSEPDSLIPEHRLLLWPWLLAALVAAGAAAFLFFRRHSRPAFAGGPEIDLFVPPEPAPAPPAPKPAAEAPQSAPTPDPPRPASPGLVVSTGLRPWLDIGMQPLRCILEDHQVTFEFELELFNSGNAPARAVLAEAAVFNAGPTQEQEIGAFFASPIGQGERIDAIPPLQRMSLRTQVVAPLPNVQLFEVGGRQLFVPLLAFNVLYQWSAGDGQTSVSYLLGRDSKSEKLAPFRADLGARVFRQLDSRLLPAGVRR